MVSEQNVNSSYSITRVQLTLIEQEKVVGNLLMADPLNSWEAADEQCRQIQ